MIRPPFVPADSAISYFEVRKRQGYEYDRYLGYTYAKRRGRRRRVHHYKRVVVPTRSVFYWIVEAPPAPPVPPKPPAPTAPPTPKGWIKAAEWQSFLDQWAEGAGFEEGVKWDGDIYKKSPASDWIARDLFVWPTDRYPKGATLKKYPDLGTSIFYMGRVWGMIEDKINSELLIWVRTARFRYASDFNEARLEVKKIEDALQRTVEKFTYLAYRGIVGWTVYYAGQNAKRRASKEGTE